MRRRIPVKLSGRSLVAAVIAGCLSIPLSQAAPAMSARPSGPGVLKKCLEVETEEVTVAEHFLGNMAPTNPKPKVGDAVAYHLRNVGGEAKGQTVGHGVVTHVRSNGHVMVKYTQTTSLPDGNFNLSSWISRNDILTGRPVSFTAEGTSGKYAGKSGSGEIKLLGSPPKSMLTKGKLCG